MLPSINRLKERSAFSRVYSKGRSYASDLVVVYVLPNRGRSTRVGFSVSKKLGGAVVRNRVKRLLREAVRQLLPQISSGYDVVVVARRKAAMTNLADVYAAISGLLKKSSVIKARE